MYSILSDNKRVQGSPVITQPVNWVGDDNLRRKTYLGYYPSPHFFLIYIFSETQSHIKFGDDVRVNNGLSIICETRIS